jgi:flagellar motor switch protein FliN/FliY
LLQWALAVGIGGGVSTLDDMTVDLTIVLGRNRMPIHMLLRMGRGAIIELAATEADMVEIQANGYPVARGQVVVTGTRIAVEITEILKKPARACRGPGSATPRSPPWPPPSFEFGLAAPTYGL